jgi:hypothetical protein
MSNSDEGLTRKDPSATMSGPPDRELERILKRNPGDKQAQADVGSDGSMDASDPPAACQPGDQDPAPCNDFPETSPSTRDEPALAAKFDIQGPDENGFVWMCHSQTPGSRMYLGQRASVAEKLCEWLAGIQYGKPTLIKA